MQPIDKRMAIFEYTDRIKGTRVMIVGFTTPHLIGVARALNKSGVNIVYWVGGKQYFDALSVTKEGFPNTVFHNGLDAIQAKPAPTIDLESLPPLQKDFIHEMFPCETQTLIVMSNTDYNNLPIGQQKHIYYSYLRYWKWVLETFAPEIILFHDIPHTAPSYVIFCLAKKFNINTVMYTSLRDIPDRVIFFNDFADYKDLARSYKELEHASIKLSDLSPELEDYYQKHSGGVDVAPMYSSVSFVDRMANSMSFIPSLSSIVKLVRNGRLFKTLYYYCRMNIKKNSYLVSMRGEQYTFLGLKWKYLQWKKIKDSFRKEYEELQTAPDFEKPFIYVPLHVQPERSTSAEGDVFADQQLMIDILSHALPEGWLLYVKEHYTQWVLHRMHMGRYSGYYKELTRKKNVRLIPAHTSSFKLIRHSRAVATVTGTAAWQAILRGKPALLFGNIWYAYCHGAFLILSLEECKKALELIKNGFVPDKQKVINFLAAIDRVSVRSHYRRNFNKVNEMTEEENIRNTTQGFLAKIIEAKIRS